MSDYWKDNGIEKPQQIVVCAACKLDGVVVCGARHWDKVMRAQAGAIGVKIPFKGEEGFIDQFGDFLSRKEAMEIVKKNGQRFDIERNGERDDELFSEGLY